MAPDYVQLRAHQTTWVWRRCTIYMRAATFGTRGAGGMASATCDQRCAHARAGGSVDAQEPTCDRNKRVRRLVQAVATIKKRRKKMLTKRQIFPVYRRAWARGIGARRHQGSHHLLHPLLHRLRVLGYRDVVFKDKNAGLVVVAVGDALQDFHVRCKKRYFIEILWVRHFPVNVRLLRNGIARDGVRKRVPRHAEVGHHGLHVHTAVGGRDDFDIREPVFERRVASSLFHRGSMGWHQHGEASPERKVTREGVF